MDWRSTDCNRPCYRIRIALSASKKTKTARIMLIAKKTMKISARYNGGRHAILSILRRHGQLQSIRSVWFVANLL